jgi:hypothetical protein
MNKVVWMWRTTRRRRKLMAWKGQGKICDLPAAWEPARPRWSCVDKSSLATRLDRGGLCAMCFALTRRVFCTWLIRASLLGELVFLRRMQGAIFVSSDASVLPLRVDT